ncbi:MAG: protein phosphatase 2C domain-containing protein [Candidatus Riflebacteria bacterium]|nr:protein phosphatase 2C domain-containing protein [Candidatus Riflebacteria bacterium]
MADADWRVIGRSVRGASHVRTGKENQDAYDCRPSSGEGPPLIVAVSDGHGSATSFRSRTGSRLAVRVALDVIDRFRVDFASKPTPAVSTAADDVLPRNLVRSWQTEVDADLKLHPFTQDDLTLLEARDGGAGRRRLDQNPRLAYGATLLAVGLWPEHTLYVQLGDGDILEVDDAGRTRRPLPPDERLIANETLSLCSPRAELDFRTRVTHGAVNRPALILLSTDGYSNSFRNDADFLKVGTDILDLLRTEGISKVKLDLGTWLKNASESGSGDDITLAIMCRLSATRLNVGTGSEDPPRPAGPRDDATDDARTAAGSDRLAIPPRPDDTVPPRLQSPRRRGRSGL